MAKNINGINFTDLSRIGKGTSVNNIINGNITSEDALQDLIDLGTEYRNIQSVLIDWNGAEINLNGTTYTINTTGELISLILEAAKHKSINSSVSNQTITIDANTVPTTLTVDQYGHLINVQ